MNDVWNKLTKEQRHRYIASMPTRKRYKRNAETQMFNKTTLSA